MWFSQNHPLSVSICIYYNMICVLTRIPAHWRLLYTHFISMHYQHTGTERITVDMKQQQQLTFVFEVRLKLATNISENTPPFAWQTRPEKHNGPNKETIKYTFHNILPIICFYCAITTSPMGVKRTSYMNLSTKSLNIFLFRIQEMCNVLWAWFAHWQWQKFARKKKIYCEEIQRIGQVYMSGFSAACMALW